MSCPLCSASMKAVEAMEAAVKAMVRWFDAEDQNMGSFHDRMDLCKYAEWAARRALGEDVGEFEGVPRLIISTNGAAEAAREESAGDS